MKQNILILILVAVISISATVTANKITSIPAVPKNIIVKSFMYYEQSEIQKFINSNIIKGYSLKLINGAGNNSVWFVVMEKY